MRSAAKLSTFAAVAIGLTGLPGYAGGTSDVSTVDVYGTVVRAIGTGSIAENTGEHATNTQDVWLAPPVEHTTGEYTLDGYSDLYVSTNSTECLQLTWNPNPIPLVNNDPAAVASGHNVIHCTVTVDPRSNGTRDVDWAYLGGGHPGFKFKGKSGSNAYLFPVTYGVAFGSWSVAWPGGTYHGQVVFTVAEGTW